ncbi:hypothetical protein SAMN05421693_12353 [Ectothiorhodospira magna]|uniref:Uncharacterized protein n=1 Tax=Ectothiorhodospira magna TaxID=867345 RepID=A0A1H9EYP8_9GAMM|nr:hypothetical protein SAMN05421693_12353 [Ectothiorhodospira magna]
MNSEGTGALELPPPILVKYCVSFTWSQWTSL